MAEFLGLQPEEVQAKYEKIIDLLEENGMLIAPYSEKAEKNLFAMRILNPKNIRIFYVYIGSSEIYGIHAYEKKTAKIPDRELAQARKIMKIFDK